MRQVDQLVSGSEPAEVQQAFVVENSSMHADCLVDLQRRYGGFDSAICGNAYKRIGTCLVRRTPVSTVAFSKTYLSPFQTFGVYLRFWQCIGMMYVHSGRH